MNRSPWRLEEVDSSPWRLEGVDGGDEQCDTPKNLFGFIKMFI